MKIIVGQDFSKGANNAIEYAKIWVSKFKGEIILVHAYIPTVVDPNFPVNMMDKLQESLSKEKEVLLKEKVQELTDSGLKSSYHLMVGDIKYAIEEVIRKESADLVIVGKANNPDFFERLIGTTSKHLTNFLTIPLLIIPEVFDASVTKNIAYASEFEYDELASIQHAKSIMDAFEAKLTFVNVKIANDLVMEPDILLLNLSLAKTDMEDAAVEYYNAKNLRSGLTEAITKLNADLLILVSHKRGVLDTFLSPSKSKKLITAIDIPILIYHFE